MMTTVSALRSTTSGRHSSRTPKATPSASSRSRGHDCGAYAESVSAYVSAFELFSIGVGPSSSHTVGPMRAAHHFATRLREADLLDGIDRVACTLYGSLGATGLGHGTPDAIVAGLQGLAPETVDPDAVRAAWSAWPDGGALALDGTRPIRFSKADIAFEPRTRLPGHPNALTLEAWGEDGGEPALRETYYSVGGGFIRRDGDPSTDSGTGSTGSGTGSTGSGTGAPYPLDFD